MRIGFLGYGEAARALHEGLAAAPAAEGLSVVAHDRLLGTDGAMAAAMAARGAEAVSAAGLAGAEWVLSAVTADQSLAALEPLLPHLRPGHLVIDLNSVAPGVKRAAAARVEAAGAAYLDMAVMAPVHPAGLAVPVLVAGVEAALLAPRLNVMGFSARAVGAAPGDAAAVKMVRSLFVKGLEAITAETLLAAQAAGCGAEILASLSASFPGLGWPGFAAYQLERSTRHGARRAAEMRDCAATLEDLGLSADLAAAVAAVQDRLGAAGALAREQEQGENATGWTPADLAALDDTLARLLAARLSQAGHSQDR